MTKVKDLLPTVPKQEWGISPFTESSFGFPYNFMMASPFQSVRRMQHDMDRMWSQLAGTELAEPTTWAPNVDISEDPTQWKVEVDLPGVDKDQISVDVREHELVIKAEMKKEVEETKPQYYRRERRYGSFERHLELPNAIDDAKITSNFKDGVLRVYIPKTEEAHKTSRHIPVK